MAKQSAGILLYRMAGGEPEVLLVHPGGPFWAKKDAGAWSIPKGEYEPGEDPLACAMREFEEELGTAPAPSAASEELGTAPAPSAASEELGTAPAPSAASEELGTAPAAGKPIDLGTVRQAGGKLVTAWALRGDFDPGRLRSNSFAMEWPPRSGEMCEFPEVDRAQWFSLDEAKTRLVPAQAAFIDRLVESLDARRAPR